MLESVKKNICHWTSLQATAKKPFWVELGHILSAVAVLCFGTGKIFLVQNLVEDIKIFHLGPFAAICDHFEAPYSQKAAKKLIGIKVQDPSCTHQNGL